MHQIREFEKGPEAVNYETKYGIVSVLPNHTESICIYADLNGRHLTVRGVDIAVRGFYTKQDGVFVPAHPGRSGITARRLDRYEDASPAAKKDLDTELARVANLFAAQHPKLMLEAELASNSNEIGRGEKEIAELEAKLRALYDTREANLAHEQNIKSQLAEFSVEGEPETGLSPF